MLSLEGKKIWGSEQGGSLMKVFLGMKEMEPSDAETVRRLKNVRKNKDNFADTVGEGVELASPLER